MSHAAKRATYKLVAFIIEKHLEDRFFVHPPETRTELLAVVAAMRNAGSVEDDPGVEEHTSGDGRTNVPKPYTWTCWRCSAKSPDYVTATERDAAAELHRRASHGSDVEASVSGDGKAPT